jgi:toxin secretion/phage lysis holin
MNGIKEVLCTVVGIIGSFIAGLLGGWDSALITLITFMAIDYISGIVVAGIFKKSPKSENGALESRAGFKGLCRKCMIILFVLIAYRLDIMIGTNYIRNAVIIAFITNEVISIIENAGLMGVPVPDVIKKGIDILQKKGDSVEKSD